jgi:site-specific DNA-methyltransferase (adenine-specific)
MCERILVGDCTTTKPDGLFHAVLCDPPYELGFMGKDWDASGIAFNPETWRRIGEHLHPGAFLIAFASSRGWHRLACAIEDAGFVFHPSIFMAGWTFASGFPKATRVGERYRDDKGKLHINEDKRFAGHRYGGQCIKPALEPIIVAQKPYSGKPVDCITRTGAGALNVDGGRIATDPAVDDMLRTVERKRRESETWEKGSGFKNESNHLTGVPANGRWPANFILLDEEAAAALDRQSGERPTSKPGTSASVPKFAGSVYQASATPQKEWGYGDTGGASRFFYNVQAQLDAADPIRYQAKASRRERDAGLEGLPEKDCAWKEDFGIQQVTAKNWGDDEQKVYDRKTKARNHHPTVKPIDLARYLATLLLPPADYAPRRILVPFSGVGSEMIGAMLAGWEEVVGIEQDAGYAEIARLRLAHWSANKPQAPAPEPELALEPTT